MMNSEIFKKKYLTFSYDDGVTQDIRLIELFNKYGMKATFNLNSQLLGAEGVLVCDGRRISHNKNKAEDVKYIYAGHEVAAHTLTHPNLTQLKDQQEIIRQVEEDRVRLSELCGYEVVGMAYPCGGVNYNRFVSESIKNHTGIQYARTIVSNKSFSKQDNLYEFMPTVYHHTEFDEMVQLGKQFLEIQPAEPQILYVWGHAFEFDIYPDRWTKFEEFLEMMSGKKDICYCTNKDALFLSRLTEK